MWERKTGLKQEETQETEGNKWQCGVSIVFCPVLAGSTPCRSKGSFVSHGLFFVDNIPSHHFRADSSTSRLSNAKDLASSSLILSKYNMPSVLLERHFADEASAETNVLLFPEPMAIFADNIPSVLFRNEQAVNDAILGEHQGRRRGRRNMLFDSVHKKRKKKRKKHKYRKRRKRDREVKKHKKDYLK